MIRQNPSVILYIALNMQETREGVKSRGRRFLFCFFFLKLKPFQGLNECFPLLRSPIFCILINFVQLLAWPGVEM